MDERILRTYVRSLLAEMGHYAPIKKATADQFPHMAKGHATSLEESLSDAIEACREIGDVPFLFRAHRTKERSSGVVVVTSEDWRRGRMGLTLKGDERYSKFMEDLVSSLGFTNLVYTSFGSGRSQFGDPSVFVPLSPYEVAWNPQIHDVYVEYKDRAASGSPFEEVIDGYQTGWPTSAPRGTEVLVDCEKYFLLSPRILSHTMFYRDKAGASRLAEATTYTELANALSSVK